ncbi:tyrosine-type recombinase/integrase [Vibrio sp. SCSIO 43132]|uniref:tyrosine-type recombinase/integrase n=1 Tax=Vibrio sp. SCSIO 43132 TaxID=2779363 RepID=UPI001CA8109B|nr:tyrosine-type recombinase/integrase [Vibrio sp. SCSIO 43132]UAB71153.1 tyrosine-type recombinase/integrase [Vibrio sp. SCSIO 43132]
MQTLKDAVLEYLIICEKQRGLSDHTIKAYNIDLKQFTSFINKPVKLNHITKIEIAAFHRHLTESELSSSSIKRKLACLKAMFKWFDTEDVIEANPFNKFRLELKTTKKLPRNVPRSELHLLLNHAQKSALHDKGNNKKNLRNINRKRELNEVTKLLSLEILISTGIRVGELVSIRLEDVFLKEKKIKIFGKGARERYVYLPDDEICKLLSSYLEVRPIVEPKDTSLLVNSRGYPASTQFIRKLIRQLSHSAKVSSATPHMLRHSAACELLDSGLDIRFVQRLLGHSSISTTEIYTHVADTTLQKKLQDAKVRRRIMIP